MAAQIIPIADNDEDSLTVSELLSRFTGEELWNAARETSAQYEGIVLAKAVQIVMRKTGITIAQLGKATGRGRTMYRLLAAKPLRLSAAQHVYLDLRMALDEHKF